MPDPKTQDSKLVPLSECPIGLFWHGDTLALKTEYGTNEGRIDAYIVSSGEFFWGRQPQTIQSQRNSLVIPIADPALEPPDMPPPSTDAQDARR